MSDARAYHHGNLRQALIDTAVRLIDEIGIERVSVREVARAARVSPAAPFRHFSTRTALLTAVAENAMEFLEASIATEVEAASSETPLNRFKAIGRGYLRWALANPAPFQVISTRALIDFDGSSLRARNDAIRDQMIAALSEARLLGHLPETDLQQLAIGARALAYGLARMYVDGQFESWGLNPAEPLDDALTLLDRYVAAFAT